MEEPIKRKTSALHKILLIPIFVIVAFCVIFYIYSLNERKSENADISGLIDAKKQNMSAEKVIVKTDIGKAGQDFNISLQKAKEKYNNSLNALDPGCYKSINDVTKKDCLTQFAQTFEDEQKISNTYYSEIIDLTKNYQKQLNDWAKEGLFPAKETELIMGNNGFDNVTSLFNDIRNTETDKFNTIIEYNNFLLLNQSQIEIINGRVHFNSSELQKKLDDLIKNNLNMQKLAEEKKTNLLNEITSEMSTIEKTLNID